MQIEKAILVETKSESFKSLNSSTSFITSQCTLQCVSCLYSVGDPAWQQIRVGQMIFFQPINVPHFYVRLDSPLKEVKPLGYHFSSRFMGQLASVVEQTVKTVIGEWKSNRGLLLWQKKKQHKLRQWTEIIFKTTIGNTFPSARTAGAEVSGDWDDKILPSCHQNYSLHDFILSTALQKERRALGTRMRQEDRRARRVSATFLSFQNFCEGSRILLESFPSNN